jgi:hypothetical protein
MVENRVLFLKNKTRNNLRSESLLKSALLLGVTLLVKKLAENAEEKIADFFKEKLACLQPKVQKQIEI